MNIRHNWFTNNMGRLCQLCVCKLILGWIPASISTILCSQHTMPSRLFRQNCWGSCSLSRWTCYINNTAHFNKQPKHLYICTYQWQLLPQCVIHLSHYFILLYCIAYGKQTVPSHRNAGNIWLVCNNVKASYTRYQAFGPELQVTISHPPGGRPPLLSARPAVTFPAAEHHRPLAGTKLHWLVTETYRCKQLSQGCYAASTPSRIWTHNLLIASPTLYLLHYLACWCLMAISALCGYILSHSES